MVKRILDFVRRFFQHTPQPKLVPSPKSVAAEVEEQGRWYFKKDILDQLDEQIACMGHLKKWYADQYNIYRHIGAVLVTPSNNAKYNIGRLSVLGRDQTNIGLGGICFVDHADDNLIPFRMGFFMKVSSPPPRVQPINGATVFEVINLHADKKKEKRGISFVTRYYVGVHPDGTVTLLKELVEKRQRIRSPQRRGGNATITHHRWQYPTWLRHIYQDYKEKEDFEGETIEEWAALCFRLIYNAYQNANLDVRVTAIKNGVAAAFTIDMLRTPYFFRDRDFQATVNGKRRKIFHIVRTHRRQIGNRSTFVRSHFRGARKFEWNGFDVTVTLPGKHHADLLDADFGMHDMETVDPADRKKFIGSLGLGRRLAKSITMAA